MLIENTGLMFSNSIMNTSDSNTQDISGMAMDSTDNFATTSDYDNFYPSSPESASEDSGDLMKAAMKDEVTAQLAASGPIGAAAAAAIISGKKRKHLHSFETNPSVRKRQQNRMLRKLKQIIDEFTIRVGQQAVVLVATPGKQSSYKVFGAKPLETIIKDLKSVIIEKLEAALAYQAPSPLQEDPSLFGLPPLVIDGIPTPVEKMTQAQLRAFIPLMLRYSTGRGKPGWGRESTRPPWWPIDLPWANVRMDARTEDEKQKTSWTHALKQIVINCYKYHGREDLLPAFTEEGETVYEVSQNELNPEDLKIPVSNSAPAQYIPTSVLHSIADGTVNIIQVDPNNPIITLADGTTAQIQGLPSLVKKELSTELEANNLLVDVNSSQGIPVHTIQTISEEDLNSIAEATLNSDGHIILTGEDGNSYPISMNNIITIPASMLQTIEANMQHGNSDGILQVAIPKIELNTEDNAEALTLNCDNLVSQPMIIHTSSTDLPQVLKVMSLKDARALAKQNMNITNVNIEEPIGSLTLAME